MSLMSKDDATLAQRGNYIIYGKYKWYNAFSNEFTVCYNFSKPETNNYWQTTNAVSLTLPNFTLQLSILIMFTRLMALALKPLHQPYFVPEILAGIMLGPTVMGSFMEINTIIIPFEGSLFLETMANVGATFYMFLVGLEMDLTPIRRIGKIALSVAIAGIILPMFVGAASHYLVWKHQGLEKVPFNGFWFWSIALSVTSFPDLARLLSDFKLLYTDLGKTALSAAVVSDIMSWFLLVSTTSILNGKDALMVEIPVMFFMTAFWFMIRPLIAWIVKHSASGKETSLTGRKYEDKHVYYVLSAVLLCGYITELCGAHSMFGAFMFGLMIPSGELGTLVMEKIEEFVVGILLPPLFLTTGLRTNLRFICQGLLSPVVVGLVVLLAFSAKIVSTLLVCLCFQCPKIDSLALGLLMNTKGVLVLIVLNEARNIKILDQQTFACMILAILLMTMVIGPVLSSIDKSVRHLKPYHRRNLERSKHDAPLRVLACVHSTKNLTGIINLVKISNATRASPIILFALHLVELTGRATAMLIFHDKHIRDDNIGNNATREKAEAEAINRVLESFEEDNHAVSIQQLTAVSPYATMHQDVSNFALDKLTNIILIPFHKQPTSYGGWVDDNPQHHEVNKNLLANAPCSIGLLVDRGLVLPSSKESIKGGRKQDCRIAMLFVGGRDDREALAYAWRISGTRSITLTVVRFVTVKDYIWDESSESIAEDDDDEIYVEKQRDDDYINEFKFRTMHEQSIAYTEKQIEGGDQIVSIINANYHNFDLYIVGRGHSSTCPLTSGLSNWTEYTELGPLGETLVSVDSESPASVLIVQQSPPPPSNGKAKDIALSDGTFGSSANSTQLQTFVNHKKLLLDDDYY